MIKTWEQAQRVQMKRYKAKKRGIAKAVRRWAKRTNHSDYLSELPRNTEKPEVEDDG